jgi:putative tryptophan/tyrosine transport system substrate-binding protein
MTGRAHRRGLTRRLALAAGLATLAAAPGRAQSSRMPRLGAIHWESAAASDRVEDLRRALGELGYVEGRSIAIEWRWADRSAQRAAEAVADLDRLDVDLMFVHSTPTCMRSRRPGRRRRS